MRKNKNGLPDRWLAYSNVGERVEGTRFIAFKVPLAENFLYNLHTNQRFGPHDLLSGQPELGLVIDLTNTHRYYSPGSVESNAVRYCKLAIPGRVVPTERLVRRFCDIVLEFLSSDAPPDALIGVHCTHGVNRTGYLICSFMIRHLLMNPREAVAAFETARGHRIERQEYVEALIRQHQRFGRRGPRRTPPREQSGPHDNTGPSNQSYAHSAAWAPQGEPAVVSWRNRYRGPWAPAPEPEAGPSRKRAPNEPLQPSPRGTRKGKRDKRPRNNQAASTSGTEGEDYRAESWRVSGFRDEPPSQEHPLPQGSSDASQNRDPPMREDISLPPKKTYKPTPSHLASPQHQPQPRLTPPQTQPSHPPSYPQAASVEHGFGHGVQREHVHVQKRSLGAGPVAFRGARERGGGSVGRGVGFARHRGRGWDRGSFRGSACSRGGRGGQRNRPTSWGGQHGHHWNNRQQNGPGFE